jgi:CHAD domain-containing protein
MAEKPAVRSDVAVGEALRAIARDTLSEARAVLDDTKKPGAAAVHDYRKAMKRWRALLRLLEPTVGEDAQRLRQEARDLARQLSGARDAKSAIEALDDLAEAEAGLSPRTIASIRGRLEAIRLNAEATTLKKAKRAQLIAALERANAAIETWRLEKLSFAELARELAKTYQKMREDSPNDWPAAEPDRLHELRSVVVVHRYQMELVEPLWPKFGQLWVAETQRLRDRLGAFQDLSVLQGFTKPHAPLVRWRSRLVPLIRARQATHAKAAQRIGARLLAERPKAFRRRLASLWRRAKR